MRKIKLIDRTNETSINSQGLKMRIIVYRNKNDVDIKFENGFIAYHRRYDDFKRGAIKNLLYPTVCGKGYIGGNKYKISQNRKATISYNKWYRMLRSCYSEKEKERFPTYKGCTVCDAWLNYQNFAEWFEKNYYKIPNEIMCLDKDILLKGNKIYSPKRCCIVPNSLNVLFTKSDSIRGDLPIGVTWNKSKRYFEAQMNKDGKIVYLGKFNSPIEAFQSYKKEKENEIKRQAKLYKEYLPEKVYDALLKYEVCIDD